MGRRGKRSRSAIERDENLQITFLDDKRKELNERGYTKIRTKEIHESGFKKVKKSLPTFADKSWEEIAGGGKRFQTSLPGETTKKSKDKKQKTAIAT